MHFPKVQNPNCQSLKQKSTSTGPKSKANIQPHTAKVQSQSTNLLTECIASSLSLTMCTAKQYFAYYKRSIRCAKTSHCYLLGFWRTLVKPILWTWLYCSALYWDVNVISVPQKGCFKSLSMTAAKEWMMTAAILLYKEHKCHKLGENTCSRGRPVIGLSLARHKHF